MSEKIVNYSKEMVARLSEVYDGNADEATRDEAVKALAEELGKSPASIRAKLTSEGLYVPKEKTPKGKRSATKAELVAAIAKVINVPEEVVESLEKANKSALTRVLANLS